MQKGLGAWLRALLVFKEKLMLRLIIVTAFLACVAIPVAAQTLGGAALLQLSNAMSLAVGHV
jgi:hypothetical protein